MERTTAAISTMVDLVNIDDENALWTGRLSFDPQDPFAVTLWIGAADRDEVPWRFARDLLASGLYDPTGEGDVQVWPCLSQTGTAVVIVELMSEGGNVGLQIPSRQVQEFLVNSASAMPLDGSVVEAALDNFLSEIFA